MISQHMKPFEGPSEYNTSGPSCTGQSPRRLSNDPSSMHDILEYMHLDVFEAGQDLTFEPDAFPMPYDTIGSDVFTREDMRVSSPSQAGNELFEFKSMLGDDIGNAVSLMYTSEQRTTNAVSPEPGTPAAARGQKRIEEAARLRRRNHNSVERRYRDKLQHYFVLLQDTVPCLRVARDETAQGSIDLHGLIPARKLDKPTILSKTIEYIDHLKTRQEDVEKEMRLTKDELGRCRNIIKKLVE